MSERDLDPLVTECPSCQTRFRVTETQLQVAAGRVRCGSCLTIFQGVDHLLLEDMPWLESVGEAQELLDEVLEELDREAAEQMLEGDAGGELSGLGLLDDDDAWSEPEHQLYGGHEEDPVAPLADDADLQLYEADWPAKEQPASITGTASPATPDGVDDLSVPPPEDSVVETAASADADVTVPAVADEAVAVEAAGEPADLYATDPEAVGERADLHEAEPEAVGERADMHEAEPEAVGEPADSQEVEPSLTVPPEDSGEAQTEPAAATDPEAPEAEPAEQAADGQVMADRSAVDAAVAAQSEDQQRNVPPSELARHEQTVDVLARSRLALAAKMAAEPVQFGSPRRRPRWWMVIGVALAVIALIGQVLWYQYEDWVRDPDIRPIYGFLCRHIGCELPMLSDVNKVVAKNLVVRKHPEVANGLLVNAIIVNQAPFEQAFPTLELRFTSIDGNLVAGRRFTPEEYLGGELAGATVLHPGTPIHVELAIEDPGAAAVNYRLTFR